VLIKLSTFARFEEAGQLAAMHLYPAESTLAVPTWPWWVQAQVAFYKGDLPKVSRQPSMSARKTDCNLSTNRKRNNIQAGCANLLRRPFFPTA